MSADVDRFAPPLLTPHARARPIGFAASGQELKLDPSMMGGGIRAPPPGSLEALTEAGVIPSDASAAAATTAVAAGGGMAGGAGLSPEEVLASRLTQVKIEHVRFCGEKVFMRTHAHSFTHSLTHSLTHPLTRLTQKTRAGGGGPIDASRRDAGSPDRPFHPPSAHATGPTEPRRGSRRRRWRRWWRRRGRRLMIHARIRMARLCYHSSKQKQQRTTTGC